MLRWSVHHCIGRIHRGCSITGLYNRELLRWLLQGCRVNIGSRCGLLLAFLESLLVHEHRKGLLLLRLLRQLLGNCIVQHCRLSRLLLLHRLLHRDDLLGLRVHYVTSFVDK